MELSVFITNNPVTCSECKEDLGRGAWITLRQDKGPLCLSCADLDHLLFLPSGDAALTRRSKKHSTLCAVVLQWSRARKRYERQGLLVEAGSLELAEQECLADADVRQRRQEREAERRAGLDQDYIRRFAARIQELYPHCPPDTATKIAEHACQKYSGRVGRSAAAKQLDVEAVRLAVTAHVRHAETKYDQLLANGVERHEARMMVAEEIHRVLDRWERR